MGMVTMVTRREKLNTILASSLLAWLKVVVKNEWEEKRNIV